MSVIITARIQNARPDFKLVPEILTFGKSAGKIHG
jgi:hypothetical protein